MATISQAFALAEKYQQAGHFQYATQICQQIVDAEPDHASAWNMLGVIAYQTGSLERATDCLARAVAAQPGDACFRNNLGVMYYTRGKFAEAQACYEQALRIDPAFADAHNNLGNLQKDQGKLDEAVASYRRALQFRPDHSDAHNNLGNAYRDQHKLEEAAASYRSAIRLRPNFAQAHSNLGTALRDLGRHREAEASYRDALRYKPDFAEVHTNLGVVLQDQGKVNEAEACFRESRRLRPDYTEAHVSLAIALAEQGKVDEAIASCKEAIRLNPDLVTAYYTLGAVAGSGGYRFSDVEIDKINSLLASGKLSAFEAGRLHFTLAGICDKKGAIDDAFAHYQAGNEQRLRHFREHGTPFDPERHRNMIMDLIATFDKDFFARLVPFGLDTELPVFIVGMPRSGTTLVEQILASHPLVYGAGELRDIPELAALLPGALHTWEKYPVCLSRLDGPALRAQAADQLRRLAQRGGQAERVVDKQPRNRLHVGLITVLFPRARVIHCVRDPMDTCLSCYQQHFDALNFTSSLEHLGFYYRHYQKLMAHWREVLPKPMFELPYEDLVADLEGVSRQLVSFCGLEWDDRCLAFHENQRAVQTASTFQVRRPVYRSSVGRWKRYESHLKPLVDALAGPQDESGPLPAANGSLAPGSAIGLARPYENSDAARGA